MSGENINNNQINELRMSRWTMTKMEPDILDKIELPDDLKMPRNKRRLRRRSDQVPVVIDLPADKLISSSENADGRSVRSAKSRGSTKSYDSSKRSWKSAPSESPSWRCSMRSSGRTNGPSRPSLSSYKPASVPSSLGLSRRGRSSLEASPTRQEPPLACWNKSDPEKVVDTENPDLCWNDLAALMMPPDSGASSEKRPKSGGGRAA